MSSEEFVPTELERQIWARVKEREPRGEKRVQVLLRLTAQLHEQHDRRTRAIADEAAAIRDLVDVDEVPPAIRQAVLQRLESLR